MAVLPRNTVDIIEQIVSEMTPDFVIGSKITNPDGTYTLNTTNTYWLHANQDIVIGGNKYTIIDFVINESITIKDINSAGEPIVNVFNIPAPLFIHGKTVKASKELAEQKDVFLRLPFIWLYEVLSETTIIDRLNPWGLESTPIIYFMDEAQSENWTSADHKVQILDPLRQMIQYFMFIIESNKSLYRTPDSYNTEARANWGRFVSDRGAVGRFFNDQLSGHKLDFDLVASKKACDTRLQINPCVVGVTVSTTDETVLGANDGTATANVTNAQGNITYLWDDPLAQTTQTATGLAPRTYTVIASDDNGCTATDSGTVAAAEFSPTNVPNTMRVWVKADDNTSFNGGSINDLDAVSAWNRQAPSTVDFFQGSAINQPTYHSNGFGTNDMPYVDFTGNEWLRSLYSLTQPFTTVIIAQKNSSDGVDGIYGNEVGVDFQIYTNGSTLSTYCQTVLAYGSIGLDTLMIKVVNFSVNSKIGVNNLPTNNGDSGTGSLVNPTLGRLRLGTQIGDLRIAEVMQYEGVVSDSDLLNLWSYSDSKYGL